MCRRCGRLGLTNSSLCSTKLQVTPLDRASAYLRRHRLSSKLGIDSGGNVSEAPASRELADQPRIVLTHCQNCHRALGVEDAYCAGCGVATGARGGPDQAPVRDPSGPGGESHPPIANGNPGVRQGVAGGWLTTSRAWFRKQSNERQTLILAGTIVVVVLALEIGGGSSDSPMREGGTDDDQQVEYAACAEQLAAAGVASSYRSAYILCDNWVRTTGSSTSTLLKLRIGPNAVGP